MGSGFKNVEPYAVSPQMAADRAFAAARHERMKKEQAARATDGPGISDPAGNEGEGANGIGGDFTAHLPKMIAGEAHEVRPDYGSVRDKVQSYGKTAAAGMAESDARKRELARTMREIDLKAESMRPGVTGAGQASDVTEAVDQANRFKWDKMLAGSRDLAQKKHDAKYGLAPHEDRSGFLRVDRI